MAVMATSLVASSAFGAVTLLEAPSGASYVEQVLTKYYVYAGFTDGCASNDGFTCNSCAGLPSDPNGGFSVCNPQNAYPDLQLVVRVDLGKSGLTPTDIKFRVGGGTNALSPATTPVISGTAATVVLKWSEICNAVTSGNSNCTTDINTSLGVGYLASGDTNGTYFDFQVVTRHVDSTTDDSRFYTDSCGSNEGFCGYTIRPGDEKIYIKDLLWGSSYPSTGVGGIEYSNLLFFFRPTEGQPGATVLANMDNQDDYFSLVASKDISPPVEDDRVTGLENGVEYCFVLANQDKTGIISRFAPNVSGISGSTILDPTKVCGTPEEVFGLLDNKKCFIATAAFGSEMSSEVQTFREFRNQYLLTNKWGQAFVHFYYEHSPKYAKIIAQNDVLRAAARGVLWPILGVVKLALTFGFIPVMVLLLALLSGGAFILRRRGLIRGEA